LINGETKTGLTTFFLKHEIDTGDIILQKIIDITPEDNAGSLHDRMMEEGADLVVKTLELICDGKAIPVVQKSTDGILKKAPKLKSEMCFLNFE
jgi:methionyl-tRNA formyltransferase